MKILIISGIFCCAALNCEAQQNTVATGGDATGTGGSVSFTVGQIDYVYSSGSGGSVNQGVQQPFEFFLSAGIDENSAALTHIYPNPTFESVILELGDYDASTRYELFDTRGRLVRKGSANGASTTIPMSDLSPGEYHLTILQHDQQTQSVKIIKH